MTLRGQNIKTTSRLNGQLITHMLSFNPAANFIRVGIWIRRNGFHDGKLNIATQFNVCTATRHIGGNCHSTKLASIRHNFCFLLMLAGVQNIVGHISGRQKAR